MGDQIGFQEAWSGLIPLFKGANGDLLFEQRPRFGGRMAARERVLVGLQETISGGRAHREEKTSVFLDFPEDAHADPAFQRYWAGTGSSVWRRSG